MVNNTVSNNKYFISYHREILLENQEIQRSQMNFIIIHLYYTRTITLLVFIIILILLIV